MKNYFRRFINMTILIIFLMISWACPPEIAFLSSYPSPEEWPDDECSFFTPFTVQYEASFDAFEKDPRFTFGPPIPNAKVTIQVKSVVMLPSPIVPDTCYQYTSVINTFTGFTGSDGFMTGYLTKEFNFTFGSTSDYFILEITVEKEGYITQRLTRDYRYFFYDFHWIPSNTNVGPLKRKIPRSHSFDLLPENTNP